MVVDERSRHGLFLALERVLGGDEAVALMEHLPPSGWEEMATKADLAATATELRTEITAVQSGLARLETSVDQRFDAVDQRFDDMQGRLLARIGESEQRVLASIRAELVGQSRLMVFSLVGALTANTGLVLATLRFGS